MFLRKFSITAATLILLAPFVGQTAQAADFSAQEVTEIHDFQQKYASLSKKRYKASNIYAKKPHLKKKFRAGTLKPEYIRTQLDYINYYRSLFGLPELSTTKTSNANAQKTAAVMAAVNANPFVNQHGLHNEVRPSFISKSTWKLAKYTSETSNLNFNVSHQSAGDVITDLVTDHYNLTGSDTGHRAWLLSTRLSTTGIGAAYGKNGYRYSVQKVLNSNDMFRTANQPTVAYPSTQLFPEELATGKNILWSLYLSNKTVKITPEVTIKDLDTNTVTYGTHVKNYSSSGYGHFKTIITYSPGSTKIIAGHEYEVNIHGIYKYTFKAFKQDGINDKTQYTVPKVQPNNTANNSLNSNTAVQSPLLLESKVLKATMVPETIAFPNKANNLLYKLTKNNLHNRFFQKTVRIKKNF